ncbi:hypothetical protein [Yinghuangia sp. YIM S09857]|uniref:hypothetical protein n=1 Tax=Yinghuangia sp. YIM S09857 TaxID=3436929 RepID=UPI003F531416
MASASEASRADLARLRAVDEAHRDFDAATEDLAAAERLVAAAALRRSLAVKAMVDAIGGRGAQADAARRLGVTSTMVQQHVKRAKEARSVAESGDEP